VVVPSYNNAAHIAETLRSIQAQTWRDYELIVADHSSTDDTPRILAGFADDPRITLLMTEAGGGAERNWNRVSREATGEFLKLVCGDDLLHPEALALQIQAMEDHPGAVLVSAPRRIVDSRGEVVFARRGLPGMAGPMPGLAAVRACVRAGTNIFGEPACTLMRRDALAAAGWWDSRFPFVIDQATYSRVLGHGDLVALRPVLADFRLSATQWSVALARQQHDQVREFHGWLAQEYPQAISATDVWVGDARARLTALGRRAIYFSLSRRLR
jgi:glycosyltransferase involved in cell wall biosynthesis